MPLRPLTDVSSSSEVVRQFTPNWFTVTMGTGILSVTLAGMAWDVPGRLAVAEGLWLAGGALWGLFAALFLGRLLCFPETVGPLLRHPVQSMFLGAIPMGLAPVVSGLPLFGPRWVGEAAVPLAQVLWWADAVLAVGVALLVPYVMLTRQDHGTERMTPVWLLPIVGPEVTAAGGGVLAPHLAPDAAQAVVAAGYGLWALSVPLAFSIITLAFQRYALHKLPPADMAASVWLIVGPIGTGALGLLTLGQAAAGAFAGTPLAGVAGVARDAGLIGGALLWAAGAWWVALAVLVTIRYLRRGVAFNLGWWGYTFPLGVFVAAAQVLGRLTGLGPLEAAGTAGTLALAAVWLVVAARTLGGMWRGSLFRAPCLVPAPRQAAE